MLQISIELVWEWRMSDAFVDEGYGAHVVQAIRHGGLFLLLAGRDGNSLCCSSGDHRIAIPVRAAASAASKWRTGASLQQSGIEDPARGREAQTSSVLGQKAEKS